MRAEINSFALSAFAPLYFIVQTSPEALSREAAKPLRFAVSF